MDYLPFTRPTIDEETIAGVADVLRSRWIASWPNVKAFEQALSEYLGGRIVRTFTSATGALEVALQACGIGPGDEVIVPAMTFAASANVVMRVGATPVFVDVELDSRNLDLARLEAAITPRTRAVMPVHFAGLPVDMDRLYALARQHGLRVIEDAAHAIGSAWNGRRIGSFGDMLLQLHPNKNMTTIEGGALRSAGRSRPEGSRSAPFPRRRAKRGRQRRRSVARRQVQPERCRRAHRPVATDAARGLQRQAAPAVRAISSGCPATRRAGCRHEVLKDIAGTCSRR